MPFVPCKVRRTTQKVNKMGLGALIMSSKPLLGALTTKLSHKISSFIMDGRIYEVRRLFLASGSIISSKCQARHPKITTFAFGRLTRVGNMVGALIFYKIILGPLQNLINDSPNT